MKISGEFIFERSIPEPNSGCWLWLNALKDNGYGLITIKKNGERVNKHAHRLSYSIFNGPMLDNREFHKRIGERLGRQCIGIELSPEYAEMARRRIKADSPLFADVAA